MPSQGQSICVRETCLYLRCDDLRQLEDGTREGDEGRMREIQDGVFRACTRSSTFHGTRMWDMLVSGSAVVFCVCWYG